LETYFVDSNVFYYHFLQDKAYGPSATGIIRRIRNGEASATSVVVVSELVSLFEFRIMQADRRKDISQEEKAYITDRFKDAISDFQHLLDNLVHLDKLSCSFEDAQRAFPLMSKHDLEFNDSLNLSIIERENIPGVYSFDKAYGRIPWLTRKQS